MEEEWGRFSSRTQPYLQSKCPVSPVSSHALPCISYYAPYLPVSELDVLIPFLPLILNAFPASASRPSGVVLALAALVSVSFHSHAGYSESSIATGSAPALR